GRWLQRKPPRKDQAAPQPRLLPQELGLPFPQQGSTPPTRGVTPSMLPSPPPTSAKRLLWKLAEAELLLHGE
uniref:Uncharacterized protein n=1 Tax=Laticauda laticaudata TaxID=8630 RepID=A0A8C5S337_LATLA